MAWVHDGSVNLNLGESIRIHCLADFQLGSKHSTKDAVKQKIDEILSEPNSAWVILGDIEDDDRPTTRTRKKSAFPDREEVLSSAARDHLAWIDAEVLPMLAPLVERPCFGVLAGHHWTQISENWNSVQYICRKLTDMGKHKVPYVGVMSYWLRLGIESGTGKKNFTRMIHLQHGVGGSQVAGGSLRRLERARRDFVADAYVRAHDCHLEAAKVAVLRAKERSGSGKNILSRSIPLLNIGSASQSYVETLGTPEYGEMEMMSATAMGWGVLEARHRKAWAYEDPSQNSIIDFRVTI